MNEPLQKIFVVAIGVIVVLFLILDGGAMTEATISNQIAANSGGLGHSWIWIIPTLLIFGLGFLLAWFMFDIEDEPHSRESMSDKRMDASGPSET